MPNVQVLRGATIDEKLDLEKFLSCFNKVILKHFARKKQIAHSYFLASEKPLTDSEGFSFVFVQEIFPLLEEYSYRDYNMILAIFVENLVDKENHRLNPNLDANDPIQ